MIRQKRKFSMRAIALGIVLLFTPNAVAQAAEVMDYAGLKEAVENGSDSDVTLIGNINRGSGSSIEIKKDRVVTINLNGQTIDGNNYDNGSMFKVLNGGELTISDSSENQTGAIINGNSNFGGVIRNQGGSVEITGGNFSNNSAYEGGVIYNEGGSVTITGGGFSDNSSKTFNFLGTEIFGVGGVIFNEGGDVTITGGNFTGNSAKSEGGVIYNDGGDVTIAGGHISGNKAKYAGVILNYGGETTITGGEFNGNKAEQGGVVINSGNLTVNGGTFINNNASNYGGVIASYGYDNDAKLIINGGTMQHNTAGSNGGAIDVDGDLSEISIGGSAIIKDNTVNGKDNNIEVNAASSTLSWSGKPFTSAAHVGITIANNDKVDISDASSDMLKYIKLDDSEDEVLELVDGKLTIISRENHTNHTYGNYGSDRYTCASCGEIDEALKARADAADAADAAANMQNKTEEIMAPINDNTAINVEATVSNGTATVKDITAEDINQAVDNGNKVVIDMSAAKQEVKAVVLSKTTVDALAKTKVEIVEVKLSNANIVLDKKAVEAVNDKANGDVKFVLESTNPADLNSAQKDSVQELDVASSFTLYVESNGARIDDFKGGKATVNVKFDAESGRDPKYYHIYAVADDGTLERCPTKYLDGVLQFKTDSLSDYIIVYDETMENETV